MNTIKATEGKWLYNGSVFAKEVSTYGDTSVWTEVTEEYKASKEGESELSEPIANKIAEIEAYDTSEAVNGFSYGGQTMWIDKATRVGLVNAVDAAILVGKDSITFGISDISVTMPCTSAKAMLAQLEMYALDCYNVTLQHKAEVSALTSIEALEAYDITSGYPEKLAF